MSATSAQKKAIWTPSWYEMDQSIAVGVHQKFWFFHDSPQSEMLGEPVDLVFFNQLDSESNSQIRFAQIEEIYHDVLGPLARVDTDGLDYIFIPVDGEEILVNAEEEPGSTYESEFEVDDWSLLVTLSEVSEPISEIV